MRRPDRHGNRGERARRGVRLASLAPLLAVIVFARPAPAGCAEQSLWAYEAVPAAFRSGEVERVYAAIDEWWAACGPQPDVVRIDVLARIWADDFDPETLTPEFVDHLVEIDLEARDFAAAERDTTLDDVLWTRRFDRFSRDLAADLIPVTAPGTVEYLLARFYAGESEVLWQRIDAEPYASTWLGTLVRAERERLSEPQPVGLAGLYLGQWNGRGRLEPAGGRLAIGLQLGGRVGRFGARLAGDLLVGNYDGDYVIRDGENLFLTNKFTGLSALLEPSVRVTSLGPVALDLTAGVGWAGVEALSPEVVRGIELPAVWAHSLVRTAGVNARWEIDRRFLELQFRWEWSDWSTGADGSDLDGEAWQIRIGFGGTTPSEDVERRRELLEPRRSRPR